MRIEKWRNPSVVLLLFRDGAASDWPSLCHALNLDPNHRDTPAHELASTVRDLIRVRLLTADGDGADFFQPGSSGSIRVSDSVREFFAAFNLSLKELAATNSPNPMFVAPLLFERPGPISPDKQLDLFILMPFSPNMKGVYEDHIKNVAANLKLKVARADDFFTVHDIVRDIWTAICKSRVILADCTGRNPNVFYEIGLAHAVGKPVVLITQNSEDVPFDLRQYRYIHYEYTPRGMKLFESTIEKTLQEAFDELKESW